MFIRLVVGSVVTMIIMAPAGLLAEEGAASAAMEIGSTAGALSYCKEKLEEGDAQDQYSFPILNAMKRMDALPDDDEAAAEAVKKKVEADGEYLGAPLTQERCRALRKLSGLKGLAD